MANSLRTERITSSGGVVFRGSGADLEVLLCGRNSDKLWALPKGTPEANETLEQTALREVREETGVEVEVDGLVGEIKYWFSRPREGVRYYKTVRHYLLRPIGGDPSLHDHEFDEVRWLPAGEALQLLTYPNEVRILNMALDLVRGREEGAAS
ncbi:MAG TPA: NUDIX hydrolase [Dehalococcoidia bacterium]|nr:NUDIX hydrolase [Dehalococcoidia bacterium]